MATSALSDPASSYEACLRFPTAPSVIYTATATSNELGDSGSYVDVSTLSTAALSDLNRMHISDAMSRSDSAASHSGTPVKTEEEAESGSARNAVDHAPQPSNEPVSSAPALRQHSSGSSTQPGCESRPVNSSTGTGSLFSSDSRRKEVGAEKSHPYQDELLRQLQQYREENRILKNAAQINYRNFEEEKRGLQKALASALEQVSTLESSVSILQRERAGALDQVSVLGSSLSAVTTHRDRLQSELNQANTQVSELQNEQNRFTEANYHLNVKLQLANELKEVDEDLIALLKEKSKRML